MLAIAGMKCICLAVLRTQLLSKHLPPSLKGRRIIQDQHRRLPARIKINSSLALYPLSTFLYG